MAHFLGPSHQLCPGGRGANMAQILILSYQSCPGKVNTIAPIFLVCHIWPVQGRKNLMQYEPCSWPVTSALSSENEMKCNMTQILNPSHQSFSRKTMQEHPDYLGLSQQPHSVPINKLNLLVTASLIRLSDPFQGQLSPVLITVLRS